MTETVAHRIIKLLSERGLTIGFAESLTGGLLVDQLVTVPGASRVVQGALVTYATKTKTTILGVPAPLIATHGVVSGQVATAMAKGALEKLGADLAIATTGVAGPEPQDGRRVGEVFLGFAQRPGLDLFDSEEILALDLGVLVTPDSGRTRAQIRQATVRAALGVLVGRLDPHED